MHGPIFAECDCTSQVEFDDVENGRLQAIQESRLLPKEG
jgi:hypothetical protein